MGAPRLPLPRIRDNIPNMEQDAADIAEIDRRIAERLKALRAERGWSLAELASRSGVSRTTLSRLENARTSPTAAALGRLCAAFGLPVSRLMSLVEAGFAPLVPRSAQAPWRDRESGMVRRPVSPPSAALAGEAAEIALPPGRRVAYPEPPRAGLEHHLVLLEGRLEVAFGEARHALGPGDCLRYRLDGPSVFATPPEAGARYLLFTV